MRNRRKTDNGDDMIPLFYK